MSEIIDEFVPKEHPLFLTIHEDAPFSSTTYPVIGWDKNGNPVYMDNHGVLNTTSYDMMVHVLVTISAYHVCKCKGESEE